MGDKNADSSIVYLLCPGLTLSFEKTLNTYTSPRFLQKLFIYLAASGLGCIMWYLSLEGTDFLVVVPGLSCSAACGILVPRSGIEPMSPALQGRFLTTGPPVKSLSPGF